MKKVTRVNMENPGLIRKFATYSKVCLIALAVVMSSCDDDDDTDLGPITGPSEIVEVQAGNITGNVTWTADKVYRLNGFVRVGTDPAASGTPTATGVLTIEPGTLIIGDRESKGTLIVQRGSKIMAQGTKEKPIIFTSERTAGQREPGDWGGVVICGKARNNNPGGVGELEGQYGGFHGGTDDADNSGILTYVRIEFAGVPIQPNQEINSLTMGSVGNGTKIENVMCSYGLDDAFEWFGGTVNCKNLIAYRGLDDDFDVDSGYKGTVQFAVGIRGGSLADQSGSNGFEVDNDGSGTASEPFTAPQFSNVSIIGPKKNRETAISLQFQNAAHLRRNNKIKIFNSFFTGYPNGIFIDGGSTSQNALNNDLVIKNSIIAGVENWGGNGYGSASEDGTIPQHPNNPRGIALKENGATAGFNVVNWFMTPAYGNEVLNRWEDAGLSGTVFELGAPTFTVAPASKLGSGASFSELTGFQTVAYRGAFGSEDWTTGWAEWNATTKNYLLP